MPFVNNFTPVNFINKSTQATGTPDIDAGFLNTFQAAVDTQGDGLATYSSDLEALEATVTALGTPYIDRGLISGLDVEWVSTTQIRVTSGVCYVPATGNVAEKTTDSTLTPTGLAANTWYYVYATDIGGTLAFDNPSTTAPVAYFGKAKQKSGDSSRRYVGSFRTQSASAAIMKFRKFARIVMWLENTDVAPLRIITGGSSTTNFTIDASGAAPVGCFKIEAQLLNFGTATALLGNSEMASALSNTNFLNQVVGATNSQNGFILLDSSRSFQFRFISAPGANSLYGNATAYYEDR